jgi:hypothetical protein
MIRILAKRWWWSSTLSGKKGESYNRKEREEEEGRKEFVDRDGGGLARECVSCVVTSHASALYTEREIAFLRLWLSVALPPPKHS